MNILLINHYAGSINHGMEYRPFYLARHWVKSGHHVSIVASSITHVRKINPKINGEVTHEVFEGVNYFWLKNIPYAGNNLKRILNILIFVFKLFRYNKDICEVKPDVVIASSTYPLDIFPAYLIAKKNKAKLIFEIHDLWPLSPMELGGYSKWHPFIMVMQFAENFAYKFSDKVVSILPKVAIHVLSHGLSLQKLALIPNGIELSDWGTVKKLPENVSEKFNELRGRGSFIIGYAGAHGIANSLDTLVEAAKYLRTEKVEFVLVGKGPEKDNLQMLAKKYKLNNVHFIDALNKADIPSFLSNCDSLYIGLKRCSLFRFGVSPNKLLDYMMAKKPILYAIDAGNDYVKQASCGVSVEAENPLEIVKGIRKLKSTHPSELNTMGERGQGFLLKNFNYKILANKFIAEIME